MPLLGYSQTIDDRAVGKGYNTGRQDGYTTLHECEDSRSDLIRQGWETIELDPSNGDHIDDIRPVLDELGIRQDTFHILKHLHSQQVLRNGRVYPVSSFSRHYAWLQLK